MARVLHLLCAGAARSLVGALQERFESAQGARVAATFGAVGAMRDALRAGAPCDVLVVTEAMVEALVASGELRAGSPAQIGGVATAVAVSDGAPRPALEDGAALKASLLGASAIYLPDTTQSTAGAHVAKMLAALAVGDVLAPRLRTFANGATAMAALAAAADPRAIGCTQASEILATPGLALVAPLPPPFALTTVYSAAVTAGAANEGDGARFVALLAGPATLAQRRAAGFASAAGRRDRSGSAS